jgi:2-phosphosulfolactate phosphatase
MKVNVAMHPAEIARLKGTAMPGVLCVVFDVLRATSSILTGLAHGMREIIPVETIEEALQCAQDSPGVLLGGERGGDRIPGFALGNSPAEYREHPGATVVTTTTNGTVALRACAGASEIWVGAVLNLEALAGAVVRQAPEGLLLVCAGTFDTLALEDVWAAGRLLHLLEERRCAGEWSDAAATVASVARQWPEPLAPLRASRNGQALVRAGRAHDVDWCAQENLLPVVGRMEAGRIRVMQHGMHHQMSSQNPGHSAHLEHSGHLEQSKTA